MEYQRTLAQNKSLSLNAPEFEKSSDLKTGSTENRQTADCKIIDDFGDNCSEKHKMVPNKVLVKSGSSEGISYYCNILKLFLPNLTKYIFLRKLALRLIKHLI